MQKYTKLGFSIEVDLHYMNYIVRANILKYGEKDTNTYDIMLELRRSDIPHWDTLDGEHFTIDSININMSTYNFIMDKFRDGFFRYPIERYEYELQCFDRGSEILDKERSSHV